jgi:hypothetical protein
VESLANLKDASDGLLRAVTPQTRLQMLQTIAPLPDFFGSLHFFLDDSIHSPERRHLCRYIYAYDGQVVGLFALKMMIGNWSWKCANS